MSADKPTVLIQRQEHDSDLLAKKVSMVSSSTVYAVVNIASSSAGTTVYQGTVPWSSLGTVTLGDSIPAGSNNIGDVDIASSVELTALATVTQSGTVTVDATDLDIRDLTSASDSVAAVQSGSWDVTLEGGVTVFQGDDPWSSLGTVSLGASIPAGSNNIGDVDIASSVELTALTTTTLGAAVPTGTNYIGLASVNVGNELTALATVTQSGTVTVDATDLDIRDLTSASDSVAAVQSGAWDVTLGSGVTVYQGSTPWNGIVTVASEVVLDAGTSYVGLATVDIGSEVISDTLHNGFVSCGSGGTAVQFPNLSIRWGIVEALSTNGANVFIGNASVSADNGLELQPGQMSGLAIDNFNKTYVSSATSSPAQVRFIGGL